MNRLGLLALCSTFAFPAGWASAQFDPASVYRESDAVAERYRDPPVRFATPGFAEGKQDFTSQAEMMAFLRALEPRAPQMKLAILTQTQQSRDLPALIFTRHGLESVGRGLRPVVMLIGQQHGNEPAGGEAMLVLAERIGAGDLAPLLDAVDVVIVPRGNPDGADRFRRALADGIDPNRDHTQLRSPEIRAISGLFTAYRPDVVLDCHEFTVGGRWVAKTGGLVRVDAMLQPATVPNLAPGLKRFQDDTVLPAVRAAFDSAGLSHDWYHTTDGSSPASPVAMGGIGADTGRNVAGLRNAISILLETRGIGIGRAHFARRVHAHVVAAEAILRLAAEQPAAVLAVTREAEKEVIAIAPGTPFIVTAKQHPELRRMLFVDPATGLDRPVEVTWLSSLTIEPELTRPRPAGYLLPLRAANAVEALERLGVRTQRIVREITMPAEHYRVVKAELGAKEDGRGEDTGAGKIVKGVFSVEPGDLTLQPGAVYIGLDQPLAALISVMLEPESATGLAANRVLPVVQGETLDVVRLHERPRAALSTP